MPETLEQAAKQAYRVQIMTPEGWRDAFDTWFRDRREAFQREKTVILGDTRVLKGLGNGCWTPIKQANRGN